MNETEANQNMDNKCPQCGAPLPSGVLAGLCPACLLKQGAAADTALPPETPPFQPPAIEEVARLFPQLEILAFIGKGGMGAVYKARQPALDRIVALKILPPQTTGGPGFVERFNREARALAKLSHPNIVAVYEFGQANGLPFFIMEFVDGLNLRQLEQAGQLSPREALQIVPQICEALQFAHDEGIIHRDIKPENILMDKKGRVKIADFGIAKIVGATPDVAITETKGAIGTPHYMAPEQVEHPTTVDHRADIFSLGVVFYEMLTGELPLGKFSPPSSRKVEVDVRLDDVVLRALEKDPERRYQHVSQVKMAVDTIVSTVPPLPPPSGEALAREILARDYDLDIASCLRRGWALVRGDFWPIVGVSALISVLWFFAHSSGSIVSSGNGKKTVEGSLLGFLLSGPLFGGLYLFFLKRIRGETTTVETAFAGFSNRFLQLFLGSFVPIVLTTLGFICFILPGIYLLVAWTFTLPLMMDKGLDFWSAMELSRKVVSKHWWKFFAFVIILLLLKLAGILLLLVGFFIATPIVRAAAMYAYEDLFGATGQTANPASAGVGPSGTEMRAAVPPLPSRPRSGVWKWLAPVFGFLAFLFLLAAMIITLAVVIHLRKERHESETSAQQAVRTAFSDYAAVDNRISAELSHISVSFNGLSASLTNERTVVFSFDGLQKVTEPGGTNAFESIDGLLVANQVDNNKWNFHGEGQLQSVQFDMADTDLEKLVLQEHNAFEAAVVGPIGKSSRETLRERLDAASVIRDPDARDRSITMIAKDAAAKGEVEIVKDSLHQMRDAAARNQTAEESARFLAGRGLREQAIEIAKNIDDSDLRDQTLAELAR
jgi:serine/threonine protein kinase